MMLMHVFELIIWLNSILQDLAKDLIEIFTARKMGKVFFANGGSDANDTQVC